LAGTEEDVVRSLAGTVEELARSFAGTVAELVSSSQDAGVDVILAFGGNLV